MKVLIDADMKALRKGDNVKADSTANEFIYCDGKTQDGTELTVAQLKDIAKANGLTGVSKLSREALANTLTTHLNILEIGTMSEQTDTQKVEEIVEAGMKAGHDEDQMLIAVVSAGIKYKVAGKLFKQVMTDKGYMISSKDRAEAVNKILAAEGEEGFRPTDYAQVEAMVLRLSGDDEAEVVGEVENTEPKQALSLIRRYCRTNEIELPKKPKKSKGSFRIRTFTWMAEHPMATDEELAAEITAHGRGDRAEIYMKRWDSIRTAIRQAVEFAAKPEEAEAA